MKRLAMVSMVVALVLVTVAPALADTAVGGDVDLTFVDASQVQAAAATQTNEGDAEAEGLGSAAAIDQSLTIEQSQVNAGWEGVAAGDDLWWGW